MADKSETLRTAHILLTSPLMANYNIIYVIKDKNA